MKKLRIFVSLVLVVGAVGGIFSGCAYNVLFGQWKLEGTELQDGSNLEPYPIAVTIEIKRDGGIYMYDTLFATADRKGYRFTMTTLSTGEVMTGTWTLVDTYLLVYPDDTQLVYRFSAVNRE